jgi:exodeoxyribonuclease V gamma subunit
LASGQAGLPERAPSWLSRSGRIAVGRIGEAAYAEASKAVAVLLEASREILGTPVQPEPRSVDIDLGDGLRVRGRIARVFRARESLVLFDAKTSGTTGLREWIDLYIDWAALRLGCVDALDVRYLVHDKASASAQSPAWLDALKAQSTGQLRDGLRMLTVKFHAGAMQPLLFFPRTAMAYATATASQRGDATETAWLGQEGVRAGERDYAPGHARLLARDLDILDETTIDHAAFAATIGEIASVLDPQRSVLFNSTGKGGRRDR